MLVYKNIVDSEYQMTFEVLLVVGSPLLGVITLMPE